MTKQTARLHSGTRGIGIAALIALAFASTRPVQAGGTVNGTVSSTMTIVTDCILSVTDLSFGTYLMNQSTSIATPAVPGSVVVNCSTAGVALTFHLDGTQTISTCTTGVAGATHQMTGPFSNHLCYTLTGTSPSGTTTALVNSTNTINYTTTAATAHAATFTMKGTVPANQATVTHTGSYIDVVPLAVDF